MTALISKSIRLAAFTLVLASPALAADVTVRLDAGSGLSVRNSTGAIERLRVDEATGNISRNGALFVHTTGPNSTFVGVGAGNTSTTSFDGRNSAFGASALQSITTGDSNSAFGNAALQSATSGSGGSAFGMRALRDNTIGGWNSAFGIVALEANTNGGYNSAFGATALRANTAGYHNSAFGVQALYLNSTGLYNSAFGSAALVFNTTGSRNVAVGRSAGSNQTTGSDNIYLANQGVAGESGRIKIGTTGTHTAAHIAGIRGVTTGVADAIPVLIDSTGQLGTVSSSREVKKDIRDMGDATARLLALRPVTFRYREQEQTLPSGAAAPSEYGLVAEEVAEVFPELVVYDEAGKPFTVKYHVMAPMLLNEMKRQQREYEGRIAELAARVGRLEQR